jgi:ubiquinone biosynthesis protein
MSIGEKLIDEEGDLAEGPVKRIFNEKYAHYKRVIEITEALANFGFGNLMDKAWIGKHFTMPSETKKKIASEAKSIRLRLMFEELGPTFIKIGQMLSTRPDIVPEEFIDELGKLRDKTPPIPFESVKTVIEEELGGAISDHFKDLEEKPIASASIGQVHIAHLKNGKKVAVKVQRPGIKEVIKADMEILEDLAGVIKKRFKEELKMDPVAIIEEFRTMIFREIDYTIEARNIQRISGNFRKNSQVKVPKVYWQKSTKKVLAIEFIDGIAMDNVDDIRSLGLDTKKLVKTIGNAYIQMIFIDGFFHADPHHANIFVMKNGRACFLDFGAIGFLNQEMREKITKFFMYLIRQKVGQAAKTLLEISGASSKKVDLQKLEWDLRDFIDYTYLKRDQVDVARGMNQKIITIAMKHNVMLPASFVLLERALMLVEGVCRDLDPEFDIIGLAEENFVKLLSNELRPDIDPIETLYTAKSYRKVMKTLPSRLDNVLKKLESDDITIRVDMSYVEELRKNMWRTVALMAVSMIAVAILFITAWMGQELKIPVFNRAIGSLAIVVIWAIVAFLIYRQR